MKKTDLAYFAGFFDGEGSIILAYNKRKRWYQVRVSIGQANRWILERYRFAFGGSIREVKCRRPNQRIYWDFVLVANGAMEFLKAVYPYLTLKQAEAKVAIGFQEARRARNKDKIRGKSYTDEEQVVMEAQRVLLHKLKDKSAY